MSLQDAQFDRAVEIVQGLPKTGPIQTDYEEKLTMYSLYKQATVGNVKLPRPGIWEMLAQAKWDAWAKHKDLSSYEAKWLYVDALMKVLRKYSDKTMAKNLLQELESYGGETSHITMKKSVSSHSLESDSSGSSDGGEIRSSSFIHASRTQLSDRPPQQEQEASESGSDEDEDEGDEEMEDQANELLIRPEQGLGASQINRPQSSLSSHRYRTPMAGSLAMSPPPNHGIPTIQPLPGFETPSAFAEPSPTSIPSSLYPVGSSYVGFSESSRGGMTSPPQSLFPIHPQYRHQAQSLPLGQYGVVRPASTLAMERAIESVQSELAAVTERLEIIESVSPLPSRSHLGTSPRGTPTWGVGRRSPPHELHADWDLDDLGMWSLVLNPISRVIERLKELSRFFARNESRSPSMIVLRRLCLDTSFLFCVIGLIRFLWQKSGMRRREVNAALRVLWRAIMGRDNRIMIDKGV
ncbi:acyl CoA binding protein-domain-containing protein [Lentinula aciculospora]|uniref:Acyl CoA binding protein-domain-containing protein n=1 Tax=Lentinula aciculospora TaxID=153920 RepID=A0A9W9A1E2_9AGAR|nr:acyl CoA binding protein-domain-containing protein [Lentinula aciculospora]